jgi:hypothetical protein
MAKAITHREVTVTLELDEDEAILLRDIMNRIGGLASTRRGIADRIKNALAEAGIYESDLEDTDPSQSVIYFTEPIKTFI